MADNQGVVNISLVTVESAPARDDDVTVTFFETIPHQSQIAKFAGLSIPPALTFSIPAYPQSKQPKFEVALTRFRLAFSDAFPLTAGKPVGRELKVFRLPSEWSAIFDPWNQVRPELKRLKDVLDVSPRLSIKGGRTFDNFTGADYDSVANKTEVFAKAAMLNLFAKLSVTIEPVGGNASWFSFVTQILEIGRERIIAVVEPEMGAVVQTIKQNIGSFSEYKKADSSQHFETMPPGYERTGTLFSIKSREDIGNSQLTMCPALNSGGEPCLLLDADIDENGRFMLHLADVFKHKFTGGTHPYDIHEYLKVTYPTRPLGYRLVSSM